jgi:hypothetical protein
MRSSPTTFPVFLAAFGLAALFTRPVVAATFTVTTDAGSGPGSFHQAVVDASATSPGEPAEVVFDPVFFGEPRTVMLDVPLPVVRRSLSIEGPAVGGTGEPRVTISGDRNGSGVVDDGDLPGLALEVPKEATVVLRRLKFSGCWSKPTPGGAVFFRPTGPAGLTIEECVFVGNVGRWGGAVSVGGPGHQVVVRGSVFTGNRATEIDSGALHLGASPALVERCVFERNVAPNAGAVNTFHGGVELRECLFDENEAVGFGSGGAVSARFGVRVVGCTFVRNRAWSGGGLFLSEMALDGPGASIENSTISANVARGGSGGGVYGVGAVVRLRHCTVTLNHANAEAAADVHAGGGGLAVPGAANTNRLHLHNCLVAGNRLSGPGGDGGADLMAPMTSLVSLGGNVVGVGGEVASAFTQTGDVVGTAAAPIDPLLGPLASNGGPLPTHLPQAESPAIDIGVPGPDPVIGVDQRGLPRPGGAAPDAGAVELPTPAGGDDE